METRPGVWQLRASTPADSRGRYGKRTRTYHTDQPRPRSGGYPKDVARALAEFVAETRRLKIVGPQHSYGELVDEWMKVAVLEESTRYGYERYLERYIYPEFKLRRVSEIGVQDLDRFYASMRARGFSPRTIRQTHAILRKSLGMAAKWSWVPFNPAAMTSPNTKGASTVEIDAPTPDEVKALLAAVADTEPLLYLFLALSAALGSRRGETLALRWTDRADATVTVERSIYRLPGGPVRVKGTKTGATGEVAIPRSLADALDVAHAAAVRRAADLGLTLPADAYVFTSDVAGACPWQPDTISHKVSAVRDRIGLPKRVTIKNLRHFHATQLLAAGADLGTVAARLRHTDKSTTMRFYVKRDAVADRRAADLWEGIV